jgi:hypothetical protein
MRLIAEADERVSAGSAATWNAPIFGELQHTQWRSGICLSRFGVERLFQGAGGKVGSRRNGKQRPVLIVCEAKNREASLTARHSRRAKA